MKNTIYIIAGIIVLLSFVLLIVDQSYKAKLNKDGKYELKVGYSAYLGIVIQLFMAFTMIVSAIDASVQKSEMQFLFIPVSIMLVLSSLFLILEVLNHRVTYDAEVITKTNFLKVKTEIDFKNLQSIKYTFFGIGRNLIFKDNIGNKIKVYWHLNGFGSFVKYLKEKSML